MSEEMILEIKNAKEKGYDEAAIVEALGITVEEVKAAVGE